MPARESLWVTVTEQQQQQQHYFVPVKHYYFFLLLPILISHSPFLFLSGQAEHKSFWETRERQPFSTIRQSISATATERDAVHQKRNREEDRTRKHWNWKEKWKKVKLNAAAADAVSSGERIAVECLLSAFWQQQKLSTKLASIEIGAVQQHSLLVAVMVVVVVTAQLLLVISYCWY